MTPTDLRTYLAALVRRQLRLSVMIWGPPGVGKSSVVAQVARDGDLSFIDLRLGQLAPTDLRGLPVAEGKVARWLPPEFLPVEGAGVLFLDELNMAPPTLQGIAQQLILDRRVGSYVVPDGWFIWAAGNRKEDRASVFDMPAPLANRFVHLEVLPDFESFRRYGIDAGFHERILAFLSYRPTLLHKLDPARPAWPSPRSWEMANALYEAGLDVAPAVGPGAAAEFEAFAQLYEKLASIDEVLRGRGDRVGFPAEPSARYAVTVALGLRAQTSEQAVGAFRWLAGRGGAEWVQLYLGNLVAQMRARGLMGVLATCMREEPAFGEFVRDYQALLNE
ncbi:MAG TPA: MoxR family ATPase [Polyangiaceae bacterium]|nr:MoxR family ATPase [Polyangiaceae bacterium]